jgi:hypothetical protein
MDKKLVDLVVEEVEINHQEQQEILHQHLHHKDFLVDLEVQEMNHLVVEEVVEPLWQDMMHQMVGVVMGHQVASLEH